MTVLQKLVQNGDGHAAKGWHRAGHGDQAVRHTEAWGHENFAEEQARWERGDLEYAGICEGVRQAKKRGGEASQRADEGKAEWDARVATQRQANDDAQRAQHALTADQTARRPPPTSQASLRPRKSSSPRSRRTLRVVIRPRGGHHYLHTALPNRVSDEPTKLEVE